MSNIILVGSSSILNNKLKVLGHTISSFGRNTTPKFDLTESFIESYYEVIPLDEKNYVINVGVLNKMNILDYSKEQAWSSINVNCLSIVRLCEYILKYNEYARIIIVGSESGRKGSYDTVYFLAKAAIRAYVRQRYLFYPDQQLILVSPSTIIDGGMTQRRKDKDRLDEYQYQHPKKKFLNMKDLAEMISSIINLNNTYLTNTEIEFNGGKFSRMKYK